MPADVFDQVRQRFTDLELVNLTLAITVINAWNRLGIAFRTVPGNYEPSARHTQKSA